jgi:hypothetical protein
MRTPSQDEPIPSTGTLQARYRRVLSFGDVLDEGIRLFRQHWANFALVSAVALIPPGLFEVWLSLSGPYSHPLTIADIRSGGFAQAAAGTPETDVGLVVASLAIWAVFYCIWSAAVTATTEAYLRGGEPSLARVYRRALRRFVPVLLGTLLYGLGLSVLAAIGFVLLVFAVFPGLSGIVPAIALIVWWLNPAARKAWVKWLIIVCTPLGVLMYFGTRWSLYIAAIVLERRGPLTSLRRSSELIDRQVFRVLAVLTVTSTIVGVLVYTPTTLVSIPLTISSGIISYGSATEAVISEAAGVVLRILFQSVGAIVYTLLFVDLRNRLEGTDLAERLAQLELAPVTPGG